MTNTFSIRGIIKHSWELFKKNAWLLVGVTVALCIISWVLGGFDRMPRWVNPIAAVIQLFIGLAFLRLVLRLVRGETNSIKDVFKNISLRMFGNYLIATIIYAIITFVGFILLIVPGVIAMLAFQFYNFALIDKNLGPVTALRKSYHLTKGHWGKLLAFTLILIVVNILGMIPLGIGLLITIPMSYLAIALLYEWLRTHVSHDQNLQKESNSEPAKNAHHHNENHKHEE